MLLFQPAVCLGRTVRECVWSRRNGSGHPSRDQISVNKVLCFMDSSSCCAAAQKKSNSLFPPHRLLPFIKFYLQFRSWKSIGNSFDRSLDAVTNGFAGTFLTPFDLYNTIVMEWRCLLFLMQVKFIYVYYFVKLMMTIKCVNIFIKNTTAIIYKCTWLFCL